MCMDGDVVVVSVNHRLNLLGYLDLSPSEKSTKTPECRPCGYGGGIALDP